MKLDKKYYIHQRTTAPKISHILFIFQQKLNNEVARQTAANISLILLIQIFRRTRKLVLFLVLTILKILFSDFGSVEDIGDRPIFA